MTTPEERYEYKYEIQQHALFAQKFNLFVKIGDLHHVIIGTAIVKVITIDTFRRIDVLETTGLRYIYLNNKTEPDVSYQENPKFKGIMIGVKE